MSFRSALLATALVSASSAFAADLPARAPAPAPYVAAVPIFTWTGFYVGLNAGAGWNNNDNGIGTSFNRTTYPVYGGSSGNDAGFTGGVQAGYNMQFGSFVAGVEADINYIDRNNGSTGSFPSVASPAVGTDFRVSRGNGDNWFGTVRGRLGFAFDRALVYATGGLAYGGHAGGSSITQRDYGFIVGPSPYTWGSTTANLSSSGDDSSNVGWTLGGGAEWAFSNSMSLRLEYLHVDLGHRTRTYAALSAPVNGSSFPSGQTISVRESNKFDIVRAGVNFRF